MTFTACRKPEVGRGVFEFTNKTYLAMGDSYTAGDAVYVGDSFPVQLVAKLNASGVKTDPPHVFAFTGWTTTNLLEALKLYRLDDKYDFVTLLIGVNNQYMKQSKEVYRQEFRELLDIAVSHSRGGRATVFVLSIPDWSVTPFGKLKDTEEAVREVASFNEINRKESGDASVTYIDITEISRLAAIDPAYTSGDSLHPSGKMYAEWAEKLFPLVKARVF